MERYFAYPFSLWCFIWQTQYCWIITLLGRGLALRIILLWKYVMQHYRYFSYRESLSVWTAQCLDCEIIWCLSIFFLQNTNYFFLFYEKVSSIKMIIIIKLCTYQKKKLLTNSIFSELRHSYFKVRSEVHNDKRICLVVSFCFRACSINMRVIARERNLIVP